MTPGRVRRRAVALAAAVGTLTSVARSAAQSPAPAASWCDRPPRQGYGSLERTRVSSPWFTVYRVARGVYAVYEPHQFQEVISYLILGSKQALLFDTGMGMARLRPLIGELTRLPVLVLNSHTHYDHIGGNVEFDSILAMDTEFTRASAKGVPHEAVSGEVTPASFCAKVLPAFDTAGYAVRPFHVARLIRDGEVLDLGGRRLEVLSVPGHTPDAVALLDRRAGLLWTGDTFYEGPIWLFFPGTDLDAYQRSVARLAALAPALRRVFPAHNTPVASPRRLEQLRVAFDQVRAGRRTPEPRDGGLVEYRFEGFSFLMRPSGHR